MTVIEWVVVIVIAVIWAAAIAIDWAGGLHLPWVYHWHKMRRHDVHWYARNHKVTKVECRTCQWGRLYGGQSA